MSNYTAHVTRDDKWWLITVVGIDGLSQARRLGDAEHNARELIAAATGARLDSITSKTPSEARVKAQASPLESPQHRPVGCSRIQCQ